MYKISNNQGQKKKKISKNKDDKKQSQCSITTHKWSVIENMTEEELDTYLTRRFMINR